MSETNTTIMENSIEGKNNNLKAKKPGSKIILLVAVVFIAICGIFLRPAIKFKSVEHKCVSIAGGLQSGKKYFKLDTDSDINKFNPNQQEDVLEAIRYANSELGFNGSVYSKMLDTSALMGRQIEENKYYRVSWTYHPKDGLEVTYERK